MGEGFRVFVRACAGLEDGPVDPGEGQRRRRVPGEARRRRRVDPRDGLP